VSQPSPAPRFGGELEEVNRPPYVGQHTDEILESVGYGREEIQDLRAQRVIG
jgi:crotonobetainyl-CoA:carnitine CoA-transferase CaiB-like acyl-CoA transferase